ncbi:MAG: phytanoyl-CoA dioxygenase family protein [Proteobacteria bacterium]|nr:phytanoyl-CoA dioxygenase family protein [Pseudomonadota bacterium]
MPDEDLDILRAFFHEVNVTSPETRALFAAMLSQVRRKARAAIAEPPSEAAARIAGQILAEGIADLGTRIDASTVAAMRAYFEAAPIYAGHTTEDSDLVARDFEVLRRTSHYGCYDRRTILGCPHLVEIANDPQLLQIAEAYLGCPPTIYHINAWWSFAQAGTAASVSQSLHRDMDDLRFLTLFIFLTPVGPRNGAHRYIKYSHDKTVLTQVLKAAGWQDAALQALVYPLFLGDVYDASAKADALLGQFEMVWTGPAGSAVLADTHGLHMGLPLHEGERLMLWVRYGLGPNHISFGGGTGEFAAMLNPRLPQTARARYINRLLLTD